jgi:hypothetical protein
VTHDLDLATVVHALKIWRHYIIDKRCEVYTDHRSLKYIFTLSDLNLRQRRWLEHIKGYDIRINYHPGKSNVVTDTLSHRSHLSALTIEELTPEASALCRVQLTQFGTSDQCRGSYAGSRINASTRY